MSSQITSNSLHTLGEYRIRYKLMEGYPIINISTDGITATEKYLIHSSDVGRFMLESEGVVQRDLKWVSTDLPRTFPHFPLAVRTRSISFEPLSGEKPGDPFGAHESILGVAPHEDNYDPYYTATIEYSTPDVSDPEGPTTDQPVPEDPATYTTTQITVSGEVLTIGNDHLWITAHTTDDPNNINRGYDFSAGELVTFASTAEVLAEANAIAATQEARAHRMRTRPEVYVGSVNTSYYERQEADGSPVGLWFHKISNKDKQIPIVKRVVYMDYDINRKNFKNPKWSDIVSASGKVNNSTSVANRTLFYGPDANGSRGETVMFLGLSGGVRRFAYKIDDDADSDTFGQPIADSEYSTWDISYRFRQRLLFDMGKWRGWNHVWSKKLQHWTIPLRDGVWPMYAMTDFDVLFESDV
jgi:hypothetical protein